MIFKQSFKTRKQTFFDTAPEVLSLEIVKKMAFKASDINMT